MIFWLVLKLEISYRVIISWRILVSFRGIFEDYIFAWWNIWVFIILFFCLKILFNVNGKATVWHTPHVIYLCICFSMQSQDAWAFANIGHPREFQLGNHDDAHHVSVRGISCAYRLGWRPYDMCDLIGGHETICVHQFEPWGCFQHQPPRPHHHFFRFPPKTPPFPPNSFHLMTQHLVTAYLANKWLVAILALSLKWLP